MRLLHHGNMCCLATLTCSVFDCSRIISSLDDLGRGEGRGGRGGEGGGERGGERDR